MAYLLAESHYRKTVEVGDFVVIENRPGEILEAEEFWDKAQFRIPVWNGGPIKSLAVNVDITGYSVQYMRGVACVKVKITYPGDCEPDQHASGWLLLKES
jgi:hypothetical protein